jgi:two-component system sensor histidine kinase UhpB
MNRHPPRPHQAGSDAAQPARPRPPRPSLRTMRLSWRVFLANAAVLTAATVVLALSPATVSFPIGPVQALVLALGLVAMLAIDLVLLRRTFAPFEQLVAFMRTVDPLTPGRRVTTEGDPDVAGLADAFNDMLDRVERERRDSAQRQLRAQEQERQRVSRELHDEIGQLLTAAMLQLDRAIENLGPADAAAVTAGRELVDRGLEEVRHIARRLRPLALDELGLQSALVALTNSLSRRGHVEIERRFADGLDQLSPDEELVVYRIAQESLTNVLRHAHARHVALVLASEAGAPVLEITDDGEGISANELAGGTGIRGMRERALLIGARLDVTRRTERGTRVRLTLRRRAGA